MFSGLIIRMYGLTYVAPQFLFILDEKWPRISETHGYNTYIILLKLVDMGEKVWKNYFIELLLGLSYPPFHIWPSTPRKPGLNSFDLLS